MTRRRWDTRDHRDENSRRKNPDGTSYGPWHDATMALEGPVARALGHSAAVSKKIARIRDGLIAEHLGVPCSAAEEAYTETGSLTRTIEDLRGNERSLRAFDMPGLAPLGEWLADTKLLDPEGPEEMVEPLTHRRSLVARFGNFHRDRRRANHSEHAR